MDLKTDLLADEHLRLERLTAGHAPQLRAACAADTQIWAIYPYNWGGAGFEASFNDLMGLNAKGQALSFAAVVDGVCVGMTSLLGPDAANAAVEIGATYYRPEVRGGRINPAAKRLLLSHAFARGARRVQLKVDAVNARSRAAVLKLGAVQEGILRQDRLTWTGRVRDTVVFSILADEWPRVRAGLDARLAAA